MSDIRESGGQMKENRCARLSQRPIPVVADMHMARVTQIGDLIGPEFGALSYDIPAPIPVYMIRQQSSISLLWRLLFQSAEEELQHLGRVRSAFRVLERDRVNAVPDARDKLAQDRK